MRDNDNEVLKLALAADLFGDSTSTVVKDHIRVLEYAVKSSILTIIYNQLRETNIDNPYDVSVSIEGKITDYIKNKSETK